MRASRSFLSVAAAIAILAAVAFTLPSLVASDSLRSPSQRSATAPNSPSQVNQVHVLNAGLWRTDRGFNATIRITNSLVVGSLDVLPVLYMADGTRYELTPLRLPTGGESNVTVNDALRSAPPTVAAHLSEFGSASLEYRYPISGVASGTVQILDVPRSLIFVYCFGPSGGAPGPHAVEGVWWKHDPEITGFVGLTNTTRHTLKAKLVLLDADGDESAERSFTLDGRTVKLVDLEEMWERLPSRPKGGGGIRVHYVGASGDLLVTGGLQNDSIGYSATIPFLFRESAPVDAGPHTYASAGMMIGKPDPMMGFPATLRFAPYAVIRNTTEDRLPVTSSIVYTNRGQPVTVPLPLKPLRPFSTEEIDLKALMAALGLGSFDGLINLTFTFHGRPGDLLISTGSVDQTGNYVFAVQPEATKKSAGKEIPFWSVAGGSDTMISLWNPLDAAQDMAVTFRYADGSGEYRLPIHLPAKADAMISVAELQMGGQPGLSGNTFSATAQEGSATLTKLADPRGDLTVVVSAGTFNVRTATCGGGCTLCSGLTRVTVSGAGSVAVGSTTQFSATAHYSDGTWQDITSGALWDSNSSAANVNSAGVVSGAAPGSATISASTPYDEVIGGVCPIPPTYDGGCPTQIFSGSQSVNVVTLGSFTFTLRSTPIPGEGNSVISGQSAQVQVQAFDNLGNQFPGYRGTVHFSSTDSQAALPTDYTFTAADAGSHVFNATLKTVVGTGPMRDLTVKDTASGISATQDIYIWWQVNMDVEFWKNCNFVQCPNLGSYFCQTAYISSGYSQKTAFLAVTASSSSLFNQSVTVRYGSSRQVSFIGDAGPVLNYAYWNTGATPPPHAGCVSDLLAGAIGIGYGCNGTTPYGGGTILWRFGN